MGAFDGAKKNLDEMAMKTAAKMLEGRVLELQRFLDEVYQNRAGRSVSDLKISLGREFSEPDLTRYATSIAEGNRVILANGGVTTVPIDRPIGPGFPPVRKIS